MQAQSRHVGAVLDLIYGYKQDNIFIDVDESEFHSMGIDCRMITSLIIDEN
jgi:ribosomal protein L25 (general stress protein Ctc)